MKHRVLTLSNIKYDKEKLKILYNKVKQYAVDYGSIREKATKGLFSAIKMENLEGKNYLDYEEISELQKLFNPISKSIGNGNIAIVVYQPGYVFFPHTDFSRKCVIAFPILPDDGGVGVDLYSHDILDDQGVAYEHDPKFYVGTHQYSTVSPTLMDVQIVHGVRNDNQVRVQLQFSLYDDFDTCVERIQTGEFFNT